MSLKSIANYNAMKNGTTPKEELQYLKVKGEINYEGMFGVDENNGYLRYELKRKNKRGGIYK